jgi:hypothetical protein
MLKTKSSKVKAQGSKVKSSKLKAQEVETLKHHSIFPIFQYSMHLFWRIIVTVAIRLGSVIFANQVWHLTPVFFPTYPHFPTVHYLPINTLMPF